jgi:ubiquinone/menaquinone biosynthesis C-methylase UbiE
MNMNSSAKNEKDNMVRIFIAIGQQLKKPQGVLGRVIGSLMWIVNRHPNDLTIKNLNLIPSDRVLEIGCGPGYALKSVCSKLIDGFAIGIDYSDDMINAAYATNQSNIVANKLSLIRANFRDLPIKSASIHKVMASNVAYFFSHDGKELQEIFRVLSRHGSLVIYATSAESMKSWPFATRHSHKLINATLIKELLVAAGFEPHQIEISNVQMAFGVNGLLVRAVK